MVKKVLRSFTNKIVNNICELWIDLKIDLMHVKGIVEGGPKNPIKVDGWNHHTKDKREGQKMHRL
jgi:hypothetical protein